MSASPVYCFISGGNMHCVPVTSFNNEPVPTIDVTPDTNDSDLSLSPLVKMKIRNKNLLYSLNNPTLSDLNSDSNDTGNLSEDPISVSPPPTSSDEAAEISSILENYSTHAVYLPQYTIDLHSNLDEDYSQIRSLLSHVFPSNWTNKSDISIKQLTGGITNMLLSCTYKSPVFTETVLMRVYGQGTSLIIDRHREFVSHLVLNSLKLAPTIHARFSNGLVYGYLPGRSLDLSELRLPKLYPLIAQQLGNWHNSVNSEYIEDGVEKLRILTTSLKRQETSEKLNKKPRKEKKNKKRFISNVWELIEDWINIVPTAPNLIKAFKENTSSKEEITELNIREVIRTEFKWLKTTLSRAVKSPVVTCHCDLLSGNIIIPDSEHFLDSLTEEDSRKAISENPIQFIDYEYMLPAPRAFDIANHLAEWQGFECDRSAIPKPSINNPTLLKWCRGYLNNRDATDEEVKLLVHEVICYYGVPGFYWGIWAMIQSEISNIDFNYSEYGEWRLQEYWDWKREFESQLDGI